MTIFSSKFKCGWTTPQLYSHPFTEGADPPTPITANHPKTKIDSARSHAQPKYHPATCSQNQNSVTTSCRERSAINTNTYTSPTKLHRKKSGSSSSPAGSRPSPAKWNASVLSPPSSVVPLLPPPSYGLPPTPEASPDQQKSVINAAAQGNHSRKLSLGLNTKTLPAPPTSYSSPKNHFRGESSPSSISPARNSRSRSASESNWTSPTRNLIMKGPYPSALGSSCTSGRRLDTAPPLVRAGSYEPKHRPTALKLKTSNLSPARQQSRLRLKNVPLVDDETSSRMRDFASIDTGPIKSSALFGITPADVDSIKEKDQQNNQPASKPSTPHQQLQECIPKPTEKAERPRSFSTNDALNITELDKKRGVDDTPRKQRSQPIFNAPQPPLSPTPAQNPVTPAPISAFSESSFTPGSVYTSLPTATSAGQSTFKPFENLPIPWSTVLASNLSAEIGENSINSLIDLTLNQFITSPPRLLPLNILKISISEENRLKSELNKLKCKHSTLINQRDSLLKKIENGLVKIDQNKLFKMLQVSNQLTRRIDRISRQIYICNDQIRQVEFNNQEHVIGSLRITLSQKEEVLNLLEQKLKLVLEDRQGNNDNPDNDIPPKIKDNHSAEFTTPSSGIRRRPSVRFVDPPSSKPASPTKSREGTRISLCQSARPFSTATVINVDSLSFPIPPDRIQYSSSDSDPTSSSSSDTEAETDSFRHCHGANSGLEVTIDGEEAEDNMDFRSFDSHNTSITITGPSNEILIYPPGHNRSFSCPNIGLEVPHSAFRSEDDHPSAGLSYQGNSTCGHERSVSVGDLYSPPNTASIKVTAPLNFTSRTIFADRPTGKGINRGRPNSLTVKVNENKQEDKMVRLGRESLLNDTESILLSLATAPIWTKRV